MERKKIIQIVTDLFNGTDDRNWSKVQNAMADKVLLDFTSMAGGSPSILTSKQIVDDWAAFLPGFDKTHHQVSDFEIIQEGNMASVHYTGKADHFIGKEIWTVEGTYDTELAKIDNSWRITKHRLNLVKQSGNTNLPEKAAENNKTKYPI